MLPKTLLLGILAALAVASAPAAARASTVTLEGGVLVVRAAPGEVNHLSVGPADGGGLEIGDNDTPDSSVCTSPYYLFVDCPVPPGGVRLEAGDGNDILDVGRVPAGLAVTADGGAGNDTVRGDSFNSIAATLLGGDGNDTVTGGNGAETLDGGAGDDTVEGRDGPDVVSGGAGNDKLLSDYRDEASPDVIDGGSGYDQIYNNWLVESGNYQPPITVSVDGVADDGRPDEHDNVTNVESIYLNAAATLTGSDGPDELTVFNNDAASALNGRGGDDKLSGFDLDDTIDGGAGNDRIEGGYGHDTITGGPGRDVINGDVNGTTCHWIQCRSPYGNDRIDARDGEADDITCGIGDDVVQADAADTVSPDCETVQRGAVPAADGPSPAGKPAARVSLKGLHARRRGRMIVVTGRVTGAKRVSVRVLRKTRTVPVRNGRFRARLRAPRHVRVTVTAGAAKRTLKV